MKTILHTAESRGKADHGWLHSRHTFSFAGYYSTDRIHFGALRVLNDDEVAGGRGFGAHPHDNMEIISIPLEGSLKHADSMGHESVIKQGEIQVMSAGTGIVHSEANADDSAPVKFLQIWIFPRKRNVAPRYGQQAIPTDISGQFFEILSPGPDSGGLWIHQDAWFSMGNFNAGAEAEYQIKKPGNGVYAFIINGSAEIAGTALGKRDGFGIWETASISVKATAPDTRVLLMDVPMELSY